ncbi:alpha/beta hydrolase [Aureispira anguillae]|uniref:Alpha/beta hydrolase n=1 Tax=Aureispira anguillae TaxID=2864201 RepID=A0A915VJX9_9BACT|nr:alpha/beta hydrolase [Aureispira anguillae]BDS09393.1 alpha/beta hydrolase [Aureispira anguillae]
MKVLKKIILRTLFVGSLLYLLICIGLYSYQERLIFFPSTLPATTAFNFEGNFEEVTLSTSDQHNLHGLLFRSDSAKGVILYLHGNAGSLESWGQIAPTYTNLGYDIFLLDYRGYGKSTGKINSEQQFYEDSQLAYNWVKNKYPESQITLLGYSIGTATAARLAAQNHPQQLILQAPYYSLVDMMQQHYPLAPTFLLKYRFETYTFIPQIKAPVTIFHGDKDAIIPLHSSLRLKALFKPVDRLIILPNAGHNGMTNNAHYLTALKQIL